MTKNYIPKRKCISCNEIKSKGELIRIVKEKTEKIFADFSNKEDGRGAYVCKNEKCISNMCKKNLLSRSFRKKVSQSVYDDIISTLNSFGNQK